MTTYALSLSDPWFDAVRDGRKLYEGRRLTERMRAVKLGDVLDVAHHSDPTRARFQRTVVSIDIFPTFEAALRALPLDRVLPGVESVEAGVAVYFKYVRLETQLADGVVLFGLAPVAA